MWVMLDGERHPIDPRHDEFIVRCARQWHKTPSQAFDRIVRGGLRELMKVIESAAKPRTTQKGGQE